MEFAGKEVYLSKLKKEKINKIRKSEEENKEDAPMIKEEDPKKEDEKEEDPKKEDEKEEDPKKEDKKELKKDDEEMDEDDELGFKNYKNIDEDISNKLKKYSIKEKKRKYSNGSDLSDDARLSVCSAEFDRDLEKSDSDNLSVDEEPAPMNKPKKDGRIFRKEIDTNVCQIRYSDLQNESKNIILKSYQCTKCQAYLNKYSTLKPIENGKYEWKCEFCSEINKDLVINKKDIPFDDSVEKCVEPPIEIEKKTKEGDDTSLIFCFDISGSMCQSYNVGEELKEKFNKISGKKKKKNNYRLDFDDDDIDFNNFDFNQENTSYISRLDLVKISIENNINSLLKNSPDVKVGIVSFGSEIEVKGDCLSNIMKIKEKDMNNEEKIKSLGEENTNLIKSPIKLSSAKILESLKATEENGSTALGPAVLLSLSLLKNAKIGSRIFLCTDGMSNLGVGDISQDREAAKLYYTKIGEIANQKGIVINLITFEDSESEIEVLMNMVQKSGGEIIRVNPNAILDGFNDLLENEVIASEVSVRMNLNKCLTFRDKEEKDLINDGTSIVETIGNATKETETYYEFKFKKALKLAEMKDINFDELKNLTFQCEIKYKRKNGGKYVRIISKNLNISDNKEGVESKANYEIISTMEIQKTAKLASAGLYREAQAQAHITRKFFGGNKKISKQSRETYEMFNRNMNCFNQNLEMMNRSEPFYSKKKLDYDEDEDDDSDDDEDKDDKKEEKKSIKFKRKKKDVKEEKNLISKKDDITEQIFSLSKTSQNRQKNMFKRKKK